jgi:hypothetical protein
VLNGLGNSSMASSIPHLEVLSLRRELIEDLVPFRIDVLLVSQEVFETDTSAGT